MRKRDGFTPLEIGIPNRERGKFLRKESLGLTGPVRRNFSHGAGFTLIELLVVIAIIALLMAILIPTLQRIKKQAKVVACQSNLHQWGLMFSMYMANNDGRFFMPAHGDTWIGPMKPYYRDCKDSLFLCPMATKHYTEDLKQLPPDTVLDSVTKKRFWAWKYIGGGTKFHAWLLLEPKLFCSYGLNDWVMDYWSTPSGVDSLWRTKHSSNVPVFLDCVWRGARPHYLDPPLIEEDYPPKTPLGSDEKYSAMQYFCIDRHNGAINSLFMDSSVRKAGLKEMWTLKWHRYFNTSGPWTKAGCVKTEDWPKWMRKFKDY